MVPGSAGESPARPPPGAAPAPGAVPLPLPIPTMAAMQQNQMAMQHMSAMQQQMSGMAQPMQYAAAPPPGYQMVAQQVLAQLLAGAQPGQQMARGPAQMPMYPPPAGYYGAAPPHMMAGYMPQQQQQPNVGYPGDAQTMANLRASMSSGGAAAAAAAAGSASPGGLAEAAHHREQQRAAGVPGDFGQQGVLLGGGGGGGGEGAGLDDDEYDLSGRKRSRGSYRCSKCGQPKRGHTCTFQPRLKRRSSDPAPESATSSVQAELDPGMTVRLLDGALQGLPESYHPAAAPATPGGHSDGASRAGGSDGDWEGGGRDGVRGVAI